MVGYWVSMYVDMLGSECWLLCMYTQNFCQGEAYQIWLREDYLLIARKLCYCVVVYSQQHLSMHAYNIVCQGPPALLTTHTHTVPPSPSTNLNKPQRPVQSILYT